MLTSRTHTDNRCRNCQKKIDAASDLDSDATPSEGDVSICGYCGTIHLFNADHSHRAPTVDDMEALISNEEGWNAILKAQAIIKRAQRKRPSGGNFA